MRMTDYAFGFSYVGFIFLMLLMIPNLIWTRKNLKIMNIISIKKINTYPYLNVSGEVLVTCLILIFSDFNWQPWTNWNWWLMAASFCMDSL